MWMSGNVWFVGYCPEMSAFGSFVCFCLEMSGFGRLLTPITKMIWKRLSQSGIFIPEVTSSNGSYHQSRMTKRGAVLPASWREGGLGGGLEEFGMWDTL
jgi:hypothetical protein